MNRLITACILLVTLAGCEWFRPKSEPVQGTQLARVNDQVLYLRDIKDVGFHFATPEDSTKMVSEYVENWVRAKLMYAYALDNLPPEKLDIESMIQDYRESLTIYIYEREYITQNLDTLVSDEQMRSFYQENQENLKLNSDVVRLQMLKVAADAPKQDSIALWMQSDDQLLRIRLEEYAQKYATEYSLQDSLWMNRERLDEDMPWLSEQYDISQPQFIEHAQPPFTYFLLLGAFKIKETTAPFQYVKQDIEQRIINKRKMQLRKEFNDNIYKDAAKNNTFEIF